MHARQPLGGLTLQLDEYSTPTPQNLKLFFANKKVYINTVRHKVPEAQRAFTLTVVGCEDLQ